MKKKSVKFWMGNDQINDDIHISCDSKLEGSS